MPPVVIAAAIGATAVVGASALTASSQDDTNEENQQMQQDANAQNRENYQNRHQWEVEDLKKAGLNPILSANSAANVPTAQAATFSNPMSSLPGAVESGAEGISGGIVAKANVDAINSNTALNKANAAKAIVEAAKTGQDVNMNQYKEGSYGKATGYLRSLLDTLNPINMIKGGFGTK
nr:MAG: DNA pilot protein [Microviridae sp.]